MTQLVLSGYVIIFIVIDAQLCLHLVFVGLSDVAKH